MDPSATQAKIDGAIASAAITSPWWLWYFDHASHVLLVGGGILIVFLRAAILWRQWRRGGRFRRS